MPYKSNLYLILTLTILSNCTKNNYDEFHIFNKGITSVEEGTSTLELGTTDIEIVRIDLRNLTKTYHYYSDCTAKIVRDKIVLYFHDNIPIKDWHKYRGVDLWCNTILDIHENKFLTQLQKVSLAKCTVGEEAYPTVKIYQEKLELNKQNYAANDTIIGSYNMKAIQIDSHRYVADVNEIKGSEKRFEIEVMGKFKAQVRRH